MQGERFDELARRLASGQLSRRQVLGACIGTAVAALFGLSSREPAVTTAASPTPTATATARPAVVAATRALTATPTPSATPRAATTRAPAPAEGHCAQLGEG